MSKRKKKLERLAAQRRRKRRQGAAQTGNRGETRGPGNEGRRSRGPQVVGYVARRGIEMACDGDACIVAGSREAMVAILDYHGRPAGEYLIEKAYAAQLLQAIGLGGAYALDETAYGRFLPAAQAAGWPLTEEDFSDPGPSGIHLVRIGFL